MKKVRKAVIPAAGLGTRFLPFTKASPKEMLPIVDKPTLQYIVEEIVASGIEEILIVTGRNKKSIEDHFDRAVELEEALKKSGKSADLKIVDDLTNLAHIHYIRQKQALGLGHAIYQAKAFVGDEPFAVLLGDDVVYNAEVPATKQLLDAYYKTGKTVLGVQKVRKEDVCKYGIVNGTKGADGIYKVTGMVEKPKVEEAVSDIAALGRYIINPEIFDLLEKQQAGVGGEIQLTDSLAKLIDKDALCAYEFTGKRYDMGNKEGFLEATCEFALRDENLQGEFKEYLKKLVKTF